MRRASILPLLFLHHEWLQTDTVSLHFCPPSPRGRSFPESQNSLSLD